MQQLFGSGREVQRGNNRNEEQGLACWLLLVLETFLFG